MWIRREDANVGDIRLTATPPLGGADLRLGGNRILERADLAIVSVATPRDGDQALAHALKNQWGLAPPTPTQSSTAGDTRAVWTSPDQILLLFPHDAPDEMTVVQKKLGGTGYTTTQTDAWVVLELSGPDTPAALERLCPLDLHPDAFPNDASARTVMEHMGAIIVRTGPETFLLMSASSSARSFLHAVETSYNYVAD